MHGWQLPYDPLDDYWRYYDVYQKYPVEQVVQTVGPVHVRQLDKVQAVH